ncbi:hypothetical protein B7494_g8253 [Chlorociboria aeruginascens]|nr:hypothetical protein B7494_g8253 [Chlorociboria aeruginascens]
MATTTPTPTSQQLTLEIDSLLTHYLSLLDTYTSLRAELNALQSTINLNLARANFSAERGVQYNASLYPSSMSASMCCEITSPSSTSPEHSPSITVFGPSLQETSNPPPPIFGILTPSALRTARGDAVALVRDLGPRVVAVQAQMRELEIEVRRRRKTAKELDIVKET